MTSLTLQDLAELLGQAADALEPYVDVRRERGRHGHQVR